MEDAASFGLDRAAQAVARKEVSPLELARACLDRADKTKDLNVFVRLDPDVVLWEASRLTEELMHRGPRGPLHGIPMTIKDNINVKGLSTEAGSKFLGDEPARADAPIVAELRAAGALIMGKTHMHEFAYGVTTPQCHNPWDARHVAGGSTGGSAAAVSVGSGLGALGTDTAGSVRIPASFCGVTGLKPRRQMVSMYGIIPLAPSFDTCGPIARSPHDVAALWSAISHTTSVSEADLPSSLGIPRGWEDWEGLDSDVGACFEDALEMLVRRGMRAREVDPPHPGKWDRPRATVLMAEALAVHRSATWYPKHALEYGRETRAYLEYADRLAPREVVASKRQLGELSARFIACLEQTDVMAFPTTPIAAPTREEADAAVGPRGSALIGVITRLCGPINWCQLAAVTVPSGFTSSGLPVGLQLVGRDEASTLATAMSLYSAVSMPEPTALRQ